MIFINCLKKEKLLECGWSMAVAVSVCHPQRRDGQNGKLTDGLTNENAKKNRLIYHVPGRGKVNAVRSGEGNGKCIYIRGCKR